MPYYLKNEKFNIIKNESLIDGQLSYKINNLNNKSIGELNISQDNCKISLNYGDKKINLESDLNSNESYNKKVFKLIEKQKPTKYFKLNKDVLKELYDSEYEDFILEMPIAENKYETFYLKKNKHTFKFLPHRKDENNETKKHTGISYSVNFFGEKLGNLNLYESSLDFNIDYLNKNITIENLETGKLKCVSVNKSSLDNNVKNIGQLINKFDKVREEREKTNNNKKLSEKNYYENFEEDNSLDIKIENQTESIKNDSKIETTNNQNKIKPLKIENKSQIIENDDFEIEEQKPIVLNIASTDLDNLGIKVKEKISELNNANAPPPAPPTRAFYNDNRPCQRVLINVEVSYDHWTKMQPQNQLDLLSLTQFTGRPISNDPYLAGRDGRFFSEDMLGRYIYNYDGATSDFGLTINRNPWDTARRYPEAQAIAAGLTNPPWNANQPETQKLIKRIFLRNQAYVENKIRSYLRKASEVFDNEGIAVNFTANRIWINYSDNMRIRTRVGDELVRGPANIPVGGMYQFVPPGSFARTKTDNRPQGIWFNQYMGMYQKQRYPEGSFWGDVTFPAIGPAAEIIYGILTYNWDNFGWFDLLALTPFYGLYLYWDFLWYQWESNVDPEPYDECTHFIVPSTADGGYFLSTKPDTKFKKNILGVRVGQAWDNIFTPGMEDAVLDRFANVYGGKVCYPRIRRDTIPPQNQGDPNTIVITTPIWDEGLHFYVGERLPYYDNSDPNSANATEQYKHEQYIRAFTSTESHGDYLDQSYNQLNDREESHPFLNDEMPTFNHENYLPMYSNMKNTFGEALIDNYTMRTGMHLKDIGTVIPFLSTPSGAYNENSAINVSIRDANKVCNEYRGSFNWSIGILPLLFDETYYTQDYIGTQSTTSGAISTYRPAITTAFPGQMNGRDWNLVDHQELYGEWYEYGNTDYPPYDIQKWNEWMFVYGIAQSLGARYFTTESNPNTILAPLARNLNYNEANYKLEDGTPRVSHSYAFSEYSNIPDTWVEWYSKSLFDEGYYLISDITNPGDFDMDGEPLNSTYDYIAQGLQLGGTLAGAKIEFETETWYSVGNIDGPLSKVHATFDARGWGACVYPHTVYMARLVDFNPKGFLIGYAIGLVARHAYALFDRGFKYRFDIDNVCDASILTRYPETYAPTGTTFCGPTQDKDWCGTNRPFGSYDFDVRYNYYDLGTRDGFVKKYTGYVQNNLFNFPFCSVDMISWGKGFDKLTGDLIRLNMTNYAVSGQNPYFDRPDNGEQVHLTNHFRLEAAGNATRFPFYGNQIPYAKIFIPTLEYVEGDTIRAFTDRLNVRQAFRADFDRLVNSKQYATNIYQNEVPNRISYTDTNMTFRWSFVDTNAINIRNVNQTVNQLVEAQPQVVSTDSTVKIVVPSFRRILNTFNGTTIDSLYGIFPLTLYTNNTPGCESNPATKFIKIHPRKLLPINERFNRWYSSSGSGKKALKGWDFKNVWSAADGMADGPEYYPTTNAASLGYYLRRGFVNDPRMNAGTGWGTSDNYGSTNNRNWTALVYQPMEMEKADIYRANIYFNQNENVRTRIGTNNFAYDGNNRRLASPYKNWYGKRGAFSKLTQPALSKQINHYRTPNSPTTLKDWEGQWYQLHGKYNYWRSGTVDTARSPIYTNSDVNNGILNIKFDISNFFAEDAEITVGVNRCLGEGGCATSHESTVSNGSQVAYIKGSNVGGNNALAVGKNVTVGNHADGIGFIQAYEPIYKTTQGYQPERSPFLNGALIYPSNNLITYIVPSGVRYGCAQNDGTVVSGGSSQGTSIGYSAGRPIWGSKAACKVIPEDITDTLFIYGRFGLSSPLVLLRKIGGRDLNTTSNNYQPNTNYENYDVYDNGTIYAMTATNNKPGTSDFRLKYKYLKVNHTPRATFDRNEWRSIMIQLQQYDTCRTMQFNFVYKNGKARRFDEYGNVRNFSAHSPLYIANMRVNGSFYLPLCGTDTLPEMKFDSLLTQCDNKAVYRLRIPAGHNARRYQILLQSQTGSNIAPWSNPTIIKTGNINNVFNIADTTYTPNSELIVIDSIQNLVHNTKYRVFAKIINTDSYVALDTFRTAFSAPIVVVCPPRPMQQFVLYADSAKDTNKNYNITAKFAPNHNVQKYRLFERKDPSTVWTPLEIEYTTPQTSTPSFNGGAWTDDFNPFLNKPDGIYHYRLELKNLTNPNIQPNFMYSNVVTVAACFGCPPVFPPIVSEESPPDGNGNFSIKIELPIRKHNIKKLELYESRKVVLDPSNPTQLGNKIETYVVPNNLEFAVIKAFFNKRPGLYYYTVKGLDANSNPINTVYSNSLRTFVPETAAPYCGPIKPTVAQIFSSDLGSTNYLSFLLNPKCTGNKYRVIMYRLKNNPSYPDYSQSDPTLSEDKVEKLVREGRLEKFNPLITENPNSTIPFTTNETTPTYDALTGEQVAGFFDREITPKLTSYNRWYAIDIICTSCVFNNQRTIYNYFKSNSSEN
jgi:hypothetical protein